MKSNLRSASSRSKQMAHTPSRSMRITKHAKKPGLPADMADVPVCGLPASFSDKRERVTYEMATTFANSLGSPRVSTIARSQRAVTMGITDVIALMGYCTALSLISLFMMCRIPHLG